MEEDACDIVSVADDYDSLDEPDLQGEDERTAPALAVQEGEADPSVLDKE